MSSNGLSDDQVANELSKMVEFIKKEAEEKAKEIRLKANEEYEIEKSNIIRTEVAAIDHQYDLKYKQAKMQQQINKSTIMNKSRLKILSVKEEVLDKVFDQAGKRLHEISADKNIYQTLLMQLVMEGLGVLKEDKILLHVREQDRELAQKAAEDAVKAYGEATGRKTSVQIDSVYLPSSSAGGVVIATANGRITVDNTLDERLALLAENCLPRIRLDLFGVNRNRRFLN